MMANVVAVLPLKTKSCRIGEKNFRQLGGKPLYRWALDTVLGLYDDVRVFSGRETFESLPQPLQEALGFLDEGEELVREDSIGMHVDIAKLVPRDCRLLTFHATAPFITKATYKACVNALDHGYDSALTGTGSHGWIWNENGELLGGGDPAKMTPTQHLPKMLNETCGCWVYDPGFLIETHRRVGYKPYLHEVRGCEALDINSLEDFEFAAAILNTEG